MENIRNVESVENNNEPSKKEIIEGHLEFFEKTQEYIEDGLKNGAPLSEICESIEDFSRSEIIDFQDMLVGLEESELENLKDEVIKSFEADNLSNEDLNFLIEVANTKWSQIKDRGDSYDKNVYLNLLSLPFEISKIIFSKFSESDKINENLKRCDEILDLMNE